MSPRYGLLFDFYAKFNDCDGLYGSWSWFLSLDWDIVFPTIQTCNIQGVNGIMMYKTCPVVIPVCPTGDTPSPAAVSRVFHWAPGSIFSPSLLIGDITIGGINSQPAVNVTNLTELAAAMNDAYNPDNVTFTKVGDTIAYTGYSAMSGQINNSAITITFA